VAWAGLASWSGAWSPLARRPLLDGLVPAAAYRWVEPPAELAAGNRPPAGGTFRVPIRDGTTRAEVVVTDDGQVTLIAREGVVRGAPDARALELTITPLGPSTLAPLPGELVAFGNAYRVEAGLAPSGAPLERFAERLDVILLYPATADLHATAHEILWSADGRAWARLATMDAPAQQQAQASLERPGIVVVGGTPAPIVAASPGASRLAIALLVAAGCLLLVGLGFLLRARGGA
jgi:hypothetical protein